MRWNGRSMEDFTATLHYLTASFPPKVNVNKATAAQMASGLALFPDEAKAIVDYREKNDDFKAIEDLKKVAWGRCIQDLGEEERASI